MIEYENLQYSISREAANRLYHQVRLMNINFLWEKKYFLLVQIK